MTTDVGAILCVYKITTPDKKGLDSRYTQREREGGIVTCHDSMVNH